MKPTHDSLLLRVSCLRTQEVAEILGVSVWSASTTRMLISYYKENPILWDKRLKDNLINKALKLSASFL